MEGSTKAAIFLLSLDEQHAVKVIAELDELELRSLKEAVDGLSPVGSDTLDEVFTEFTRDFKKGLTPMRGGTKYLQDLVRRARGEEQVARLFPSPEGELLALPEPGRPLASLFQIDPEVLAVAIAEEHPQVAAAVLAHLEPTVAAMIVQQLQPAHQTDVLRRIAALKTITPEAFADAEQGLGGLELARMAKGGEVDGVALAATILNEMATAASELLERIGESHPEEAVKLQRAMFSFEHLLEADSRGLQQLLREVLSDTLLVALKSATEPLKEKILSCMSSRAATILLEELEMMPPVRLSDVENAQQQIVEIAMRLVAEGKMSVKGRGEEMV